MADQLVVLPIGDTLSESWSKVAGTKFTFAVALSILAAIGFGLGVLSGIASVISAGLDTATQIVANIVNIICQVGIIYIGMQRALDRPIVYSQMFYAFDWQIGLQVVLLYALQMVVLFPIGLLFFAAISLVGGTQSIFIQLIAGLVAISTVAAFIIAIFRMFLSVGILLELNENPWQSIKLSFRATRGNLFQIIAMVVIQFLIIAVSAIPLGIGLIWTLPFSYINYGTMYKKLAPNIH